MNFSWLLWGVGAFMITYVSIPWLQKQAPRWGLIDYPNVRKWHKKPTPRVGGIAVYSAIVILTLLWLLLTSATSYLRQIFGILIATTWIMTLGIMDDAGRLHHQVKLWFGMPVAALVLIYTGIHATLFASSVLNFMVTVLWVVGIVSAFNLLDNMDGLSAGTAAIAAAFFTGFAWVQEQRLVALFGVLVVGAAVGFLLYNFYPASVFLGDGGAMTLGLLLATLGLKVDYLGLPVSLSWMVPILVLGVPIFDTSLVTFSRLRRGLLPFASPGKDHLSHRLNNLGFSPRCVAMIHYLLDFLLGSIASLFVFYRALLPLWGWYIVFGFILISAFLAMLWLETVPFERQEVHTT